MIVEVGLNILSKHHSHFSFLGWPRDPQFAPKNIDALYSRGILSKNDPRCSGSPNDRQHAPSFSWCSDRPTNPANTEHPVVLSSTQGFGASSGHNMVLRSAQGFPNKTQFCGCSVEGSFLSHLVLSSALRSSASGKDSMGFFRPGGQ